MSPGEHLTAQACDLVSLSWLWFPPLPPRSLALVCSPAACRWGAGRWRRGGGCTGPGARPVWGVCVWVCRGLDSQRAWLAAVGNLAPGKACLLPGGLFPGLLSLNFHPKIGEWGALSCLVWGAGCSPAPGLCSLVTGAETQVTVFLNKARLGRGREQLEESTQPPFPGTERTHSVRAYFRLLSCSLVFSPCLNPLAIS